MCVCVCKREGREDERERESVYARERGGSVRENLLSGVILNTLVAFSV